MTNKLDEFSEFEHKGWQKVAGKYESAWGDLTRPFIPYLLKTAKVQAGTRLLDVACGPGYVAEAARVMGAEPTGVDFSSEMIRIARKRNQEINFHECDTQALDFEHKLFDVVVMNFGIHHLSRPKAAFAEAFRVLRAGGRFGFTVWAGPEQSPGAKIVEDSIESHADMSVELPAGPEYFAFSDPEECRSTLSRLGFDPVSFVFQTVTVEWQIPTASFLFKAERDAGVRTAALLAAQSPEKLEAIQAELDQKVSTYATEVGFTIPFAAHVIAITKSGSRV
ncbi:MAG: methyltransferase domain-containing protein [Bacteroidetes bacterium]|nr:methyltransferase domain-containing protein [Bacteroidota bacterium]